MDYNVHIFENEAAAVEAVAAINKGEGIPKNKKSTTTSYTTPYLLNGQWVITADEVTEKYCGKRETVQLPERKHLNS